MTGKHGDDGRVCLCDRSDGTGAGIAIRRLSLERVRELAEEIWTASSGDLPPPRPAPDPRSSRAGASARAAFARCRERERDAWRLGWTWWTCAVVAATCGGYLLIGLTVGPWLGWPMGLLLGAWTGWRLRFRPSAEARKWQRQAAMQRRAAAVLASLNEEGCLVLHDVVLPGWLGSLDHVVVGRTGVWVLTSWQCRRAAAGSPTGTRRGCSFRPRRSPTCSTAGSASRCARCSACTAAGRHGPPGYSPVSEWRPCGSSPTSSAQGRRRGRMRSSWPPPGCWRSSGRRPEPRAHAAAGRR
jgi:nuclease-like protein